MEDITKLKVTDLKRELKRRSLAITGNKQELIDRLEVAQQSGLQVDGDDDFDEDEILADEPKATDTPKSTKKRVGLKRAAETPSKATPTKLKVAKASPKANGEEKSTTPAVKKLMKETKEETPKLDIEDADETEASSDVKGVSPDKSAVSEDKTLTALKSRAERFGIPLTTPGQVAARAERFGTVSNGSEKPGVEMDKLKARAERFGEVTAKSLTKIDNQEKKKARGERFQGETEKENVTVSTDKTTISGKVTIKAPGTAKKLDSVQQKRAERFGV